MNGPMETPANARAYIAGWHAVMAGADPRYCCPYDIKSDEAYAWTTGTLDAMEAEDGERPEPACAGYGPAA
jgi:hypothetical protein